MMALNENSYSDKTARPVARAMMNRERKSEKTHAVLREPHCFLFFLISIKWTKIMHLLAKKMGSSLVTVIGYFCQTWIQRL